MSSNLNPIIDGDALLWRIGFAIKDDEPIEYCLSTLRSVIEKILAKFPDHGWYRMYIGHETSKNFRHEIATTKEYKGNRKDKPKPKYFHEMREYLIGVWGAIVVDGIESDDACGTDQWYFKDKSTVLVAIDKDLNMIPGWHYNWVKDELKYISLKEANLFFFKQMITGDSTDNIPGIPGLGAKWAERNLLLEDTIDVLEEKVYNEYKEYNKKYLEEQMDLLWIRRNRDERCPFFKRFRTGADSTPEQHNTDV